MFVCGVWCVWGVVCECMVYVCVVCVWCGVHVVCVWYVWCVCVCVCVFWCVCVLKILLNIRSFCSYLCD